MTPALEAPTESAPSPAMIRKRERAERAFSLKMAGKSGQQIADELGCSVRTAFRHIAQHLDEARIELESVAPINRVAAEVSKLEADEQNARKLAGETATDRDKAAYMRLALKAQAAKLDLLFRCGVLEAVPEKLYQVISHLKPGEHGPDSGTSIKSGMTIEQAREELAKLLQQSSSRLL